MDIGSGIPLTTARAATLLFLVIVSGFRHVAIYVEPEGRISVLGVQSGRETLVRRALTSI